MRPEDIPGADAQEAQRFGAAQDIAGVGARAGLYRRGVQRHAAIRVNGYPDADLAAPGFLPLGVPGGVERKTHAAFLYPVVERTRAGLVALRAPAYPFRPLAQHRGQALVRQAAPFVPEVLQRQVYGVHPQLFGQHIHDVAEDKIELGIPHSAHHAGRELVGVDAIGLHPDVGDVGERRFGDLGRGELEGEHSMVGVSPGIPDGFKIHGRDGAVLHRARFAGVDGRLAGVVEAFPAAVFELDGPAGFPGKQRGEKEERLVAGIPAAELAADVGADNADFVYRQAQHLADMHPALVGFEGVGHHRKLVALPVHQAAPVIQRSLRRVMMDRRRFHDHFGLPEAFIRVALVYEYVLSADGVLRQDIARRYLRVDHRRAGLHGPDGIENEREDFPVHFYKPERLFGDLLGFGRHNGAHLVGDPAGVVAQHPPVAEMAPHHALVGHRVHAVGPAGACRLEGGYFGVFICEHRFYAGKLLGQGRIYALYARVGVGAAQHFGVQHAGKAAFERYVVDELHLAGGLLQGVDAGAVGTDEFAGDAGRVGAGRGHFFSPSGGVPSDACCTARAMPE